MTKNIEPSTFYEDFFTFVFSVCFKACSMTIIMQRPQNTKDKRMLTTRLCLTTGLSNTVFTAY
ncbi:MAG: hypothetical protein IIT73_08315, partial [Treponema sp.]|nr:hypothetical protein [Treponema sp.]